MSLSYWLDYIRSYSYILSATMYMKNPSGLRAISFIKNTLQPLGPIGNHFRLRAESPIRSSNIDVISRLSIK